ncbi:glycoside hydrolase [Fennellomyces sp. T-0311]|nr:glycoside hydrolase [Fennellomyces sp. T-0311]
MIIMGLEKEYQEALKFVSQLDFTKSDEPAKGFETNIRYLGGLLSAYDLRGDKILLDKAVELTDKVLMPLFLSPSKAPYTYIDVNSGIPQFTNTILLAEFGTYSLEFTRLSQITGDNKYAEAANSIVDRAIAQKSKIPGLYPNSWMLSPFKPLEESIVNVGAGGDSFYEYLSKNYVLLGGKNKGILDAWVKAVNSIEDYLLSPTQEDPTIQFVATITNNTVSYVSDELICFWPGNILLGMSQMSGDTSRQYKFAQTFMDSCIKTWETTVTGLGPEVWSWNPQTPQTKQGLGQLWSSLKDTVLGNGKEVKERKKRDASGRPYNIKGASYNLRPETIESVLYFHRIVGGTKEDPEYYKKIGWDMFKAIEDYTRTESGYSSISNVDVKTPMKTDFEESFFFAETLKYLYLLFTDDSCMSLDNYVFSTEAHPFKLPAPINLQKRFANTP